MNVATICFFYLAGFQKGRGPLKPVKLITFSPLGRPGVHSFLFVSAEKCPFLFNWRLGKDCNDSG